MLIRKDGPAMDWNALIEERLAELLDLYNEC